MSKYTKDDQNYARERLLTLLQPGDTVYSIVRTVAKSGMSRTIDFYVFRDGRPNYLTGSMARVLNLSQNDAGALKVAGAGMDMCFACVYDLAGKLFSDGYALKSETL